MSQNRIAKLKGNGKVDCTVDFLLGTGIEMRVLNFNLECINDLEKVEIILIQESNGM